MRFFSIIISIFLLITISCSKEHLQRPDCSNLKNALLEGKPDEAENEINKICSALTDIENSRQDLNRLATAISGQCQVSAAVLCYDCINTNPAQSEIRISVTFPGGQKDKIIDISYSEDNKFLFVGMHD